MRKLQLYIKGQRVDLFKDESVELTQTIKNVKDISKIFTEFTQTFAVPASRVNNKIFKHYYNSDIVNGFDARIKQDATIEINDLPFKEGKIALQGVELKNNLAHTYKITFYGNTVDLKDILSDDQLSSLSFSSFFNKEYSFDDVKLHMQPPIGGGDNIIVPLITHTNRLIYDSSTHTTYDPEATTNNISHHGTGTQQQNGVSYTQFKYAVKVPSLINGIQDRYNIQFSDDFFNDNTNEKFWNLYMWLHRKSGDVEVPGEVPAIYEINEDFTLTSTPPAYVTSELDGVITIAAPVGVTPSSIVFSVSPTSTLPYNMQMLRNGAVVLEKINVTGFQTLTLNAGAFGNINNAAYQLQIAGQNIVVNANNIIGRVNWLEPFGTPTFGFDEYKNAATFSTNQVPQFNINQQLPEMKIIDFLTGIFKMFNLTAYVDNVGTIVVRTLDSYYAASTNVYNIDKYLDTTKSTTDVALPFNKVSFTYKGLKTFLAQQFNQLFNTKWGGLTYTLNGNIYDAPSEPYEIEIPFEHMQFERLYDAGTTPPAATDVQWGYSVNENQQAYKGEPLLFYAHPIYYDASNTSIRIRNPFDGSIDDIESYFIPSNSLDIDPTVSKVNIHFQAELNEYLANEPSLTTPPASAEFTDTLFETEYKTYIQEVFNPSNRLTKVTAILPMKVFYNLKLNDKIEMRQKTYKINSMKTNLTTGKTEFELLNTIL